MKTIKFILGGTVAAITAALCLSLSPIRAQDAGSKAGQMWKDAQSAFGTGDYARAASILTDLIKAAPASTHWLDTANLPPASPKQQWLEPAFYMLGASYFDAHAWQDAISTFGKYLQLFPHSSRVTAITFSLAQANLMGNQLDNAIHLFNSLLTNSDYHAKALMMLVESDKRAERIPDAISLLEKERAVPNLNPDYRGKISMRLLAFYLDTNDGDKGVTLLNEMDEEIAHVEDIPAFNALAIRLGDLFLSRNEVYEALHCYRHVRDNDQIIALQNQQIESMQKQRAANLARIQADPLNSDVLQDENKDIDTQIAKDHQTLTQYLTQPPVRPPFYVRIGRAYFLERKYWEAAVVFGELLRRYPKCAEAEPALYGSIVVFDKLKQNDRAQALCQKYLNEYPSGKYLDSVGYIRGALAYDAEDFDRAVSYFQEALKNQADSPRRQQIEVILGDIKLRQQKFDDAVQAYAKYRQDFPQGTYLEPAVYRTALALLFAGKWDAADEATRDYLQKYPQGQYAADGEYRLAMIQFAKKQYAQTITACVAWKKKYGDAGPLAEVLSLEGDCYALQDKDDEAVKSYISSYQVAQTAEVLNYSIFAAAKLLQKHSRWADIVAMFQDFIKNNPEHPTVVSAVSWIGRADIKLGKVDEAKEFMAAAAKQSLSDSTRDAVDEIITQLAQLYTRKPLVIPASGATPNADLEDPAKGLETVLTIPDLDTKPTARARILYAKAEMARLQRKPDIELQILKEIGKDFKPEDLSPILLGRVGDVFVQSGQPDQALPFYNHLLDDYDQSNVVDYAYNGLAQIAYNQKDFVKAEHYYFKALDKGLATAKLKDVTLGEGMSLLALGRPEEARPYFEQVASTRAWRGEAIALSVYSLGDVQMTQGKFAEANAFYQRVFVAYQKYPAIQAKAYLKSGEAFEKLGKTPEAINTYSELLKNPNLANFPETADAKRRLQQLAQK